MKKGGFQGGGACFVKSPVDRLGKRVHILAIQQWAMFGDPLHLETMSNVRTVARTPHF